MLGVISKPKKEKQESTRSICFHIITRSLKERELFFAQRYQFLDLKRERACCFTWSFKENTIGCNSNTIRPICFKICGIVALRGILQYTKRCHQNILCLDTGSQNYPFRMAEEADDRRVRDQLKVLTGLKLPGFNWNANNMRMEFDIFWQTITFVLEGMEIPKDKWYLYILQQLGREGMA